ncbi:MAG: WhiB family transcriptional regulator [Acidimicrobiales bacterium]
MPFQPYPSSRARPGARAVPPRWAGGYAPLDGAPRWRSEAACRQLPTELFFPVGHGPRAQAQTDLAKGICKSCAVQAECLDYALATNAHYGVFGGLAEDERRAVRRQRRSFAALAERGFGEPA